MPKSKEELAKISKATQFKAGKEQVETARKGGYASQKVQHEKKTMKEMLDYLLAKEIKSVKGDNMSTLEAISTAMIGQAMKGNVKAFTAIRDTIGEKPAEKAELNIKQALVEFIDGASEDTDSKEVQSAIN